MAEDPEHSGALNALDGLYEKRRDWENLISVRLRLAESLDEDARLAAMKDLAGYATKKIRRPDLTQALWEQVLEFDPSDIDGKNALVTIYEQTKDWHALVDTLEGMIDDLPEDKQKVSLQKLGSIYQDRLNDAPRAAETWRRLSELDPNNRRAGDSYKKSLIELGDWDELCRFFLELERGSELARILEGQVGVQQEDDTKLDLLFRAAELYIETLDQPDRGVRALERVRQMEPNNERAARILEPIYSAGKDFRKLVDILTVLLAAESDPEARSDLMARLAEMSESQLRNPMAAFDWLRQVVQETPNRSSARADLIRLGETMDQWGMVHDTLSEVLPQIESDEDRLEILLTLGKILEDEMASFDEALSRYDQALELAPENGIALDAVERLHTRSGRWYELLHILERKGQLAESDEDRIALMRKQALIHEEQLEDVAAAIEAYQGILELSEDDEEGLDALQRLFGQSQQGEDLRDILERQLQLAVHADNMDRTLSLRTQLASVFIEQLDAVERALNSLKPSLRLNLNIVRRAMPFKGF